MMVCAYCCEQYDLEIKDVAQQLFIEIDIIVRAHLRGSLLSNMMLVNKVLN